MPKVSDYELSHADEKFEQLQKFKRKNKTAKVEKKYPNKKDYRKNWKKQIDSFNDISDDLEQDSE